MSVEQYVAAANRLLREGVATEHPFREVLSVLLRQGMPSITIINDPGATAHGNPDLHVRRGSVNIGYVETKAHTVNLSDFERSEQFSRYLRGFLS
jgi:hypothetical protein